MGQPYKPCRYWVKNDSIIHEEGQEYTNVMQVEGMCSLTNTLSTRTGGRPVLLLSSNASIPTNGNAGKRAEDGILEVEYGYYPQTAVAKDVQEILETKYNGKYLYTTGNTYTINKKRRPKGCFFEEESLEEYEYNGKRYIKVKLPWKDHNTWFKVEPVKWLVDDKAKLMLAEKIIFTDVPYDIAKYTDVRNFDEVLVKKFMDIYLAGELVQSKGIQSKIIISQTRQKKNLLDSKSKIGTSTATQNKDLSDSELSTEETSTTTQNKNLSDSELITEETDTTTQDIIPSDLEFDQVSEEDIIRTAIESNVAIFLHGEPGCGKSDRVKQLDPDFIELNLSHLDPELLDGLAGEKEGKEIHIKPPWLEELETKCKEEPDKIHILFLEEITNASYTMQSKAYGIALDKKVAGRWKLPENARVVAAGNEEEDSLLANEVARPLYDRFAHVNIKTTVDGWLKWALTPEEYYERLDYKKPEVGRAKIHPLIYAYIESKGDEVLRTPYDKEKPEPHSDPRRWKMASDMLYTSRNPNTLRAIIGEKLTRDFISFCLIQTISLQDVINGNYSEKELNEMGFERKLATVSGLVKVDEENMPKVRAFAKKLGAEMCRKFEVQWAGGNEERLEKIQELRMIDKAIERY